MCYACPRTPRHCRETSGYVESQWNGPWLRPAVWGSLGEFGVEFGVRNSSSLVNCLRTQGSLWAAVTVAFGRGHTWVLKSVKPHNRLLDNSRGQGRDRMDGSTGCLIRGICPSCTNHVVGIGATLWCNASSHVLLVRWCKPRCRTRHMKEEAPFFASLPSVHYASRACDMGRAKLRVVYLQRGGRSNSILIQTSADVSTISRHVAAGFILFSLPPTCMLCLELFLHCGMPASKPDRGVAVWCQT